LNYDEALRTYRVVPVLTLEDPNTAADVARALISGGLPIAEVTFRTAEAVKCLQVLSAQDEMMAGAGTVVTAAQVDLAVAAGAQFVVSPGLAPEVVQRARELSVPLLPGVSTPSEVMQAMSLGFDRVKVFPIEPLGGMGMVRALAGPFPSLSLVPSGGLTRDLLEPYLRLPTVRAVGVSWIATAGLIASADYAEITRLAAEATSTVRRLR
jgi:2-dehydro-3-deoxyphosphogluconate aldolase/(4S)-4-hydroxy-2-oxoglutarate aldolase